MSHSKFPTGDTPPLPAPHQIACCNAAVAAHPQDKQLPVLQRPLRSVGRPDTLTAQRVEVGIVLLAMLGEAAASDYFAKHNIHPELALRVLNRAGRRRGSHDASGIRT